MQKLTGIPATLIVLAFTLPARATAQGTMGPSDDCNVCWSCDQGQHKAPVIPGATNPWDGPDHESCHPLTCVGTHTGGCGSLAAAEVEKRDRLSEILNTMTGEERVATLLDEFPSQVQVASTGNAIEVEGLACQEGQMIGRLRLTSSRARALLKVKSVSSTLAAKL